MQNNDLISREALLDIVGKMPLDWEYGKAVSDIYDIIKEAPAVDAVVLPCKINATVYCLRHELCEKRSQDRCDQYCDGWDTSCEDYDGEIKIIDWPFSIRQIGQIGKTVFLTREEAEAALAERMIHNA